MPRPPSRRHGLTALCIARAVLVASPVQAVAAGWPPPAASAVAVPAVPGSGEAGARTLTLVTGDTVTATRGADGTLNTLLRGPDGLFAGYGTSRVGQNTCLCPHSAVAHGTAGLLERELFHVTRLLADGYDDAQRDRLPLIVTCQDAGQARTRPAPGRGQQRRAADHPGLRAEAAAQAPPLRPDRPDRPVPHERTGPPLVRGGPVRVVVLSCTAVRRSGGQAVRRRA
ncbi:hypothetical protein OG756_40360 [Streptomyces sp. NBC_01310]|uniref:hypothetical protein n=1 Tax=Streptomyces sp. NBC_01310 TaxID=2903820 RepID=UPI0035B62158|nr:hypothetical protein OG756_01035 [Streptomyces sp. NBC_01310]WSJ63678.1 hypothetical protein OG756_40360 [Streptomyces sp. NBC_01310]